MGFFLFPNERGAGKNETAAGVGGGGGGSAEDGAGGQWILPALRRALMISSVRKKGTAS